MSKALATKNVAAVLLGFALVFGFAFAFAKPAKADTLSDLQAQVQALLAQIASLQGSSTTTGGACFTFTQNLKQGSTGSEVMQLQKFLNGKGFTVAATGAGSPGNETSYFGPATKAAVIKWQNANAATVLTPLGLTAGTGNWFAGSRAAANAQCTSTGTGTGTGTGTVTPTGAGITVSSASQPSNTLAPSGAIRVPFTTFTLTNNTGSAVTVSGITVQRTGLAQDNNFSGVVLVDANGLQVGVSHTFDANHMATVGDTFTLQAGVSQTFTVAGNIAASTVAHSGEVASIAVTGINTSVPVSGSLPITGASQTINTTLSIGQVTPGTSSFDPSSQVNKNIGDTGIKFSAVRFTAGSNEDVKFYSIRWRLNGSASPSDIGNIMTVVNGTSYPTTLSADGRYYTSTFPGGILLTKGNAVDVYVQGDIIGSNAAGRTVEFDIDRTSDVYFVGQVYGYGIGLQTATGGTYSTTLPHNTGFDTSKQPWFSGSTVTVKGGTVTTIQNATAVASQNIAVNVSNQVLGGFQTNFTGEPTTIQGLTINAATSSSAGPGLLTLVSIVDENGAVVAGPVDATDATVTDGTQEIVFSNSITFPTGIHTYTIKGKLPSTMVNGGTIQLNTTPSSWTSPQGQSTGNSVDLTSYGNFTMNPMTIRGANLTITASPTPSSQSIVKGAQNVLLGQIQLDASQSGEDIRLSSLPVYETNVSGTPSANLSTCQIQNGTTVLTTGSNAKTSIAAGSNTFTFDNSLTVPKGTVVTLGVYCNLSSGATTGNSLTIGVDHSAAPTVTGVQSGNTLALDSTLTLTTGASGTMTVAGQASVTVSVDSSSPSYAVQAAGTSGVTVGVYKIRSTNEDFTLNKLGLTLAQGTYGSTSTGSGGSPSNGAGDLTQVTLWANGVQIGTATFTGNNQTATSTLTSPLTIPRDTDVQITAKANLASIGVSSAGGIGNLVTVDPLNAEGTGAQSGGTVKVNATTGVAGVRLFKSYPTIALDTLGSTGIADGRLIRFKVTANSAGPVSLGEMNFTISTSTASVTNVALYGFTQDGTTPISGQGTSGQIGSTQCNVNGCASSPTLTFAPTTNPVQVPAGQTYYFELQASVSGVQSGSSVVTKLLGDSAYLTNLTTGYNVATSAAASSTSNFTWAGNSTTTPDLVNTVDWSNGYSLPGLPSGGLIQTRSN